MYITLQQILNQLLLHFHTKWQMSESIVQYVVEEESMIYPCNVDLKFR